MTWTNTRVEKLKQLWREGHSAKEISHRMGGISRSGVLGKIHRMGLANRRMQARIQQDKQERKSRHRRNKSPAKRRLPTPRQYLPRPALPEESPSLKLTLEQTTERTCKFPTSDDSPYRFCGHPKDPEGGPYCEYHENIAYQPYSRLIDRDRQNQFMEAAQ